MSFDVQKFACFVPRTVLEAVAEKRIRQGDDFSIGIDKFSGTVVFVDASGFTALTEALDKHPNGAEKLGDCINNFFSPLIQIVNYWGGDIIKFSGDAVTVIWPSDDAEDGDVRKSHFSSGKKFSVSATNSVLYALQCCIDLHTNLNDYPTPVEGRYFDLHIGVGFGKVQILQVGGILDRWEYVVAGDAMVQISKAEPLATNKETVVSPEVLELVGSKILWEPRELEGQTFGKLLGLAPRFIGIPSPPPLEKIPVRDSFF
ncbi:MAG: uncharacterized protein KVP18_003834 [Porospora cf. gigantea A]|uniref:uncharacterized protein n=1 Tax=Porospora cf. gigantea A TaxID=2853593 RepID=UPI003559FF24|nr:MAG: hypothetical protein KVP18_003834 [Porospora cf. gigantea A]